MAARRPFPPPVLLPDRSPETLIYITEVATRYGRTWIENDLRRFNEDANPGLLRIAAKMATGSGKTVVIAMLIVWHLLNKPANPRDARFTDSFRLAKRLLEHHFRDDQQSVKPWLFPDLLAISRQWLAECVVCQENTFSQLLQGLRRNPRPVGCAVDHPRIFGRKIDGRNMS
ncbi:MAG: DEAD/DEAH box helicase family protein [Pirellulaceae bacterium]|nr:DEAD/DEAH box helicase family protein [Pirellulaceae bacterium]